MWKCLSLDNYYLLSTCVPRARLFAQSSLRQTPVKRGHNANTMSPRELRTRKHTPRTSVHRALWASFVLVVLLCAPLPRIVCQRLSLLRKLRRHTRVPSKHNQTRASLARFENTATAYDPPLNPRRLRRRRRTRASCYSDLCVLTCVFTCGLRMRTLARIIYSSDVANCFSSRSLRNDP